MTEISDIMSQNKFFPVGTQWMNVAVWGEFWVLVKNSKKIRLESYDLSFLKIIDLYLECVFMLFPGVTEPSEFTLAIFIHKAVWKNVFIYHLWLVLVILYFTPVFPLNSKSKKCLMLWVILAIAWDFSLPHLAPFPILREINTPSFKLLVSDTFS